MTAEPSLYQELMRQAVAGDTRAYENLLKESAKLVRPLLYRHLKSHADVEDILQEILLSIHKARHTYDGNRPYRPWLFAIAKFRLQDYFRRLYGDKFRHAIELEEIEDIVAAPVTENPASHELLNDSIAQLPARQAKIVGMIHGEGFTAKEVGERLGMKESAVKVAAHRAYKLLRKKLSDI